MSVDNPEHDTPKDILKKLRAGIWEEASGQCQFQDTITVDEALAALDAYYKALANKDLSEDHPSDIHKMLFTYGEVCEKEGSLSPSAVEIRMDLSAYYSEYVWKPKTRNSKSYGIGG